MKQKHKLNTWTLSGLMIGPILGSGIILLPGMAYKALGPYAIYAWLIMMFLGSLFAYVFAKMTVQTTSNEGMSLIIGSVLGNRFREMSSNFLTAAVCFGPAAVVLTAARFVKALLPSGSSIQEAVIAIVLMILCTGIIALGITALGRVVLILSTSIGLLLVSGSLGSLIASDHIQLPTGLPPLGATGHTLLLIFWSIIGWEVLGNYIEDVKDPHKTIFRAMRVSVAAIVTIYLLTTFSLQNYFEGFTGTIRIEQLLTPLFGSRANAVFSVVAASLCLTTVLMFISAVARQMTARGKASLLPAFFSRGHFSLLFVSGFNLVLLFAAAAGWISLEWIVAISNVFFISNALLGLIAGFFYMKGALIRTAITILVFMLTILLFFSGIVPILGLALVATLSLLRFR